MQPNKDEIEAYNAISAPVADAMKWMRPEILLALMGNIVGRMLVALPSDISRADAETIFNVNIQLGSEQALEIVQAAGHMPIDTVH